MGNFTMRQLGKTGLQVSPLGIGGGSGITNSDLLYAFDHGINYFFFSSDMHHFAYQMSAQALRTLCHNGSAMRDKVVLATVSYVNHPEKLPGVLVDQFTELGIDYIDVFHWGWITNDTDMLPLIKGAHRLKKNDSTITRMIRKMQTMQLQMEEVNQELLKRGLVRYVGASFHSRDMARVWMRNLDVLMLRYNIAHPGVEQDVVPHLYGDKERDPGMIVFNTAHVDMNPFHVPPTGYPPGQYVPTIPDCYRFALSQPWVDMVLTGLSTREQIDQALAAVEKGPMSEEECLLIRQYGAFCSDSLKQEYGVLA